MAKIYGTPIMAGGAGGANKDLPPLLDNFKAFEGGGTRLKDLPSRSKVKLGTYNSQPLKWIVARDSVTQELRLVLHQDSVTAIGNMQYDAPEPSNPDSNRQQYGNNRYSVSNIHQWLNSDGTAGSWFIPSHQYDAAPDYATTKAGFLNEWSDSEKSVLQNVNWPAVLPEVDGGGTENASGKIALVSATEVGLGLEFGYSEGVNQLDIFNNGIDSSYSDLITWMRSPQPSTSFIISGVSSGVLNLEMIVNETNQVWPVCAPNPEAVVSDEPDDDGCYTIDYDAFYVTIQADKMATSRANELAGAVWVYADHEPTSVNDGTKIQLAREEVVTSDGGEAQTVTKTVEWNIEADFFARQFTYNSKKQYQTMLEGAVATIMLLGVPAPVSELAETHSGSSITLTWKNPTSDEFYDHTVVVYKTDAFPTAIDDGTQGYSGTDETATLSGLELGSTYYIAVFTVSAYGLYGEPQTVQVELPAGQLLSSLASGTKVKLGKWNNTDLQWKVARDTSDQSIRLVLEPTSVSLLGNKMWDNKEPSNFDSNRRKYGNNRYIYSNIHQWLNATKATSWYTAQHSTDAAPNYSSQAGFLSGWSENHIAALDRATLTVSRSSTDGGGTETFVSRVALMSTTELGLESGTGNGRLDIFNSNGDRAADSVYWTRTPYSSNSHYVRPVNSAGALSVYDYAISAHGVRPLCSPKSTALVSLEMDGDNCYVVQ